ncbi:MAG: Asp-tRNA(Asn)/Glu-tRNA(Gln) amidotransferase subunit GatC [Minisyncoccota bacterium]
MNAEEVLKLAKLARIEVSAEEAESLSHEFEAILGYVGQVKKIADHQIPKESPLGPDPKGNSLRNVMREDANPHESGKFSEAVLKNAPDREENYIKVKKIL